jgi:tetratricopeptide (TPR) repeat protein
MPPKILTIAFVPMFFCLTILSMDGVDAETTRETKTETVRSAKSSQQIVPKSTDQADDAVTAIAGPENITESDSPEAEALNQKITESAEWHEKAYAAYTDKKYPKALEYIKKALAIYPQYSTYHELEAYIFIKMQDYNNAVKAVDAGLKVSENDPALYEIKANCLHELKQSNEALVAYRKMFEFRNNTDENINARWFYNYLYVLSDEELSDEAIKVYTAFKKIIADGEEIENIEDSAGDIHFYASIAFNRKGNAAEEMSALNEAIAASPDYSGYYNNRGSLYESMQKHTEALADFNRGISLDKKSADLYYNRGRTYVLIKNYEKALKDFLEAEDLGQKNEAVYLMMGNAYKGLKKYDQALASYQKVLAINPANKEVQNNIAMLHTIMGKPELSTSAYQQASTTDTGANIPFYNQANDLMESGKVKDAIVLYKKALAIKPNFPSALNQLGICYIKLKQYELALETLSKAIMLDGKDSMPYMNRATAYQHLGKIDLAQNDYQTALKLEPQQAAAYYALAFMYQEQGNIESADQYYKLATESGFDGIEYYIDYSAFLLSNARHSEALNLALKGAKQYPNSYQLLINLASAYDETGDEKKNEATLKKAITINPNDATAYYNLGNFYFLKKKDLPQAQNYYLNAIEKNPELIDAQLNLASVYAGMNKKEQALDVYKKLISKSSDNHEAYYNRGAYFIELGMMSEAIADFEKSFALMDQALIKQKNNAYALSKLQSKNSLLKAQAYQLMARYEQAASAYETYLKFNAKDAGAYSNFAYCLIEMGDLQKALASLEKSYQLDQTEIDSLVGLVAVNYLLNNKSAVSKYKSVIKRDFSDFHLNADMLNELSKYGYAYTDTFKRIWNDAMKK